MMPSSALPPSVLESGLLGSVTSIERLARIQASGIGQEDFAVWSSVYRFICDYADQYHGVPSQELIRSKWEEWDPTVGEFEYWLKEFVRHASAIRAEKLIREAQNEIEKNPEKAIPDLVSKLASLQLAGNTHIIATDASIGDRVAKYHLRREVYEETGGKFLWGIPTGLDVIDKTHQGWMTGELVGFYARPTVGKTWMLVREAAIAWATGKRVLLVSPEVSTRQVALRVDVFLAHALGITLSHKRIFEGNPDQAEAYARVAEAVKQSERWITIDSIQGRQLGLRDIRAKIQEFEPDMVCIDGVMLLHDDQNARQGWEKMDNICYGLKNLATALDTVIMISHQAVNTAKGKRNNNVALGRGDDFVMPTLNDAAGGEGFVRACTTIFTMCPDIKHKNLRWFSVRKTRERDIEDWKPRYALGWDVDKGHIEDLSKFEENLIILEQQLEQRFT